MPTKEFLTITQKAEKNLKASVVEQVKLIQKQWKNLENFPKKKDYKSIVDVFDLEDKVKELNDKATEKAIENFMKAPLGKDLRRNVAYMMILRSLREISHDAVNIGKYINTIQGFQIDKNWVYEISGKIVRRLNRLLKILENETLDGVGMLIEGDKSVNELYKKLLKKFANQATSTKKRLTPKEKDQAILGFIMALKNFEHAGDSLKEIAESIRFVITGKFQE